MEAFCCIECQVGIIQILSVRQWVIAAQVARYILGIGRHFPGISFVPRISALLEPTSVG